MSSSLALQAALVSRMTSDVALTTLLGGPRVFDDVPQPQAFPFVTISQTTTVPDDGLDARIEVHSLTLHIWSRARGRREVANIIARLRVVVTAPSLELIGHHLVNLQQTYSESRRDSDGETIRGLIRFRAVTEPLE